MFHPLKLKAAERPSVPYAETAIYKPTYAEEQDALSKALTIKAEKLIGKYGGQCVVYVRSFAGVGRDKVSGLAKNTKVNSQDPEVGAIVVLRMSWAGHVGVVLFATMDRVYYTDSNGNWRQTIAIRSLPLTDKRIKGYLN